ncbi:DUF1501 domain-containing protein [bacterium]|nr:DUF1501 domain-containing protein [bacterium]
MTKPFSRRKFLQVLSQTGGAALLGTVAGPSFSVAQQAGSGANIVVVNLLGGLDGLMAYPFYEGPLVDPIAQRLRPSFAQEQSGVLRIDPQTGISSKVGLHPEFAPLVRVAGDKMKIVQGYGIPDNPGRSHDTCQVIMSLGRSDIHGAQKRGFLARLMDLKDWDTLQYWAFEVSNPSDVNTAKKAPVQLRDLESFGYRGTYWEDRAQVSLAGKLKRDLLELQQERGELAGKFLYENRVLHDTAGLVQRSIINQEVGSNDAGDYDDESSVGVQLRDIAKIIRSKETRRDLTYAGKDQVFLVSQTGYDTHSDQANPHRAEKSLSGRLRELSTNLATFYRDMQLFGVARKTYVILYSEFGRTLYQNAPANYATAGTDHGYGSTTIVLGGNISSGVIGEPPTLAEIQDEQFNALRPRIDYRNIFAEVFSEVLGVAPELVFPDSSYRYEKLGILS